MDIELRGARTRLSAPAFISRGVTGIVTATVINTALFLAASTFTFRPNAIIEATGTPVGLANVVIATVIGGIIGVAGYALLRRLLPSPDRMKRVLYVLAAIVLLVTAYGPFTIRNVSGAQVVVMEVMHIVAGIVPLYAMIHSARTVHW